MVVKSLVLSYLNYGAPLLFGVTSKLLNGLQQIINAAVRLIHGLRKYNSIGTLLQDEGLLPIETHIKLRSLLLIRGVLTSG